METLGLLKLTKQIANLISLQIYYNQFYKLTIMENLELANHIIAMSDDAHLTGHPEWESIVAEAREIVEASKDNILIGWCIEDVMQQAGEDEKEITENEAHDVLRFVNDNMDANFGVSWDTISMAIDEIIGQRATQIL